MCYIKRARQNSVLRDKISGLGIRFDDIREVFTKSSGPGGQNVNKNSTCVYLKHIPTGIEVKCAKERSQALNRQIAWSSLLDKIENARNKIIADERARMEKRRRQARRRSKAAQNRILEEKRRNAERKRCRKRVRDLE